MAYVSIPSRGFWFFEAPKHVENRLESGYRVSIPSRGFWFFEASIPPAVYIREEEGKFQSPRGDFGFLKSSS